MTEQLNVQQMAEKLLAADNILILCHKNPDGDTVGCGSALYYALLALEKHAAVLCADPIPGRYAFTNPRLFKGEFEPQIVVAVDVASVQLFGEGNGVPQYTRHVDLCIDHHAGNSGYAEFTLLDGSAAAKQKENELWAYLKAHTSAGVYRSIRYGFGGVTNLKIPKGDKLVLGGYRIAQRIFKFN